MIYVNYKAWQFFSKTTSGLKVSFAWFILPQELLMMGFLFHRQGMSPSIRVFHLQLPL